MDDDLADLATLTRSSFSIVMTELLQQFTEKNLDASVNADCSSTSSGFGSFSSERTNELSECSWSCSSPEFHTATGTISLNPQYSVKYIMGPICKDTIQNALRNLRPVPHPKDFLAKSFRSLLPSPVPSPRALPRTSTSFTAIGDLKVAHDKEDAKNIKATPSPCPENIYGWQTGTCLNRGLNRHTNCIELDTDMTDRFIIHVDLKQRKRKRGLLSRLRLWKTPFKSNKDICGIGSDENNKDKKRCGGWRLFCCF